LAGTSDTAIPFFLNQHKEVKELVFCLDNDPAGREAAVNMARKYADKGYRTRLELPTNKDFNEDLQAISKPLHVRKPKQDICI
jgi:DNA primase